MRFLPIQRDANGALTGRRLVNNADLAADEKLTVTLPESVVGNRFPQTAGATLLVIYRDGSQPLTGITIYEGAYVQRPGQKMTQKLRGFLQSSTVRSAKLTHIVSSGAANATERLYFNTKQIATDPFKSTSSPSTNRGWSNPTFNVTPQMPGADPGGAYGEEVTTTLDYQNASPNGCLAWNAIVFSTNVQDTDGDGLVDKLERTSGLREPDGRRMPDVRAMGADYRHKDLFIEIGAMRAAAGTTYGSVSAPLKPTQPQVTDTKGHNHMPTPAALKMVGDGYAQAPVINPDGKQGVNVHFDVGPLYKFLGTAYRSNEADKYLVRWDLARGGELMKEVACVPSATLSCQFPDYPGTVSWKIGYQLVRDAIVGPFGEQLTQAELDFFDRLHRYLPGATAIAAASTARRTETATIRIPITPTAAAALTRIATGSSITCSTRMRAACRSRSTRTRPTFTYRRAPPASATCPAATAWSRSACGTTSSALISPSRRPPCTSSATSWSCGTAAAEPVYSGPTTAPTIFYEPNCKPNYQSVMSYLFQLHGVVDDAGVAHLDYSRQATSGLDESKLVDGTASNLSYRMAWYEPLLPGTLA